MAEVPTFSNDKVEADADAELSGGGGGGAAPLCTATYDEAKRTVGAGAVASGGESHVCDLTSEHDGPHYCSTCDSHWVARTGVGSSDEAAQSPQRKQIALSRMDATMLGTGFVMITRSENGKYSYLRVNPEQISLQAPDDGWPDNQTAEDVGRAATEILQRRQVKRKLKALITEGETRKDRHMGWVHTALLKQLLEDDGDGAGDGGE